MDLLREIAVSSLIFLGFSLLMFVPVEHLLEARRRGERAPVGDWFHFWFNTVAVSGSALTVMAFIGGAIRAGLPSWFLAWTGGQPVWLQLVLVVVLAETWSYWAHRLAHAVPLLWRFHRVHHSIEHMTWVSALRQHPFDAIWIMAAANVPAFALGVDLHPLAGFILFERFYTILLHANIDFSYGPLDRILASTRFHHWHHEAGPVGRNRNFAGMFSILDTLFGTFHSTEKAAETFGPANLAPGSWWRQMSAPFAGRLRGKVAPREQSLEPLPK